MEKANIENIECSKFKNLYKDSLLALSSEDSSNIRCISEIKYIGNRMFLKYLFKYTNYKSSKFNNKIYFSGHIDNILSFLLKYETYLSFILL